MPLDNDTQTAIGLARLEGRIEQVIVGYDQRITALEKARDDKTSKTTGVIATCVAAVSLVISVSGRIGT